MYILITIVVTFTFVGASLAIYQALTSTSRRLNRAAHDLNAFTEWLEAHGNRPIKYSAKGLWLVNQAISSHMRLADWMHHWGFGALYEERLDFLYTMKCSWPGNDPHGGGLPSGSPTLFSALSPAPFS